MSRDRSPSAVVRLDDRDLQRWISELPDEELALGLRSLIARAAYLLTTLELVALDDLARKAEEGATLAEIFEDVRRAVLPIRAASEELSQAFVTVGHIDVHAERHDPDPAFPDATEAHGAVRLRTAKALSASRRLIAREWRTLKARLEDDTVRSSPGVLVTFCRAHLDRVHTLVECIAPAIYAVVAPPGIRAESSELDAALAIRCHVVDFHKTVRDVDRLLDSIPPTDWLPHLQVVAEALDRLLYGITFSWLRDPDQRMLTDSREILDETLALWSPLRAEPVRHVLSTLRRVGESLLRINDRPSLIDHDITELQLILKLPFDRATDIEERRTLHAAMLVRLDSLYGRDGRLDLLGAAGLAVGGELDIEEIRARSIRILAQLQALDLE